MRRAGISELKARLSEYLDRVKAGEEVLVTERGRVIARISPVEGAERDESRLAQLVRRGLVRPPRRTEPIDFSRFDRPADPEGLALRAILEEREDR